VLKTLCLRRVKKFKSQFFFFYCGRAKAELKSASGLLYLSQPSVAITDAGFITAASFYLPESKQERKQASPVIDPWVPLSPHDCSAPSFRTQLQKCFSACYPLPLGPSVRGWLSAAISLPSFFASNPLPCRHPIALNDH
jgi:hypothetical protein